MTPQQLMDLPYAGMAEKELRKAGLWQLTEVEKLEKQIDDMQTDMEIAVGYLEQWT